MLIEQFAYKNSREDRILNLILKYQNCQDHFKNLKCYQSIKKDIETIFKLPVDFI